MVDKLRTAGCFSKTYFDSIANKTIVKLGYKTESFSDLTRSRHSFIFIILEDGKRIDTLNEVSDLALLMEYKRSYVGKKFIEAV